MIYFFLLEMVFCESSLGLFTKRIMPNTTVVVILPEYSEFIAIDNSPDLRYTAVIDGFDQKISLNNLTSFAIEAEKVKIKNIGSVQTKMNYWIAPIHVCQNLVFGINTNARGSIQVIIENMPKTCFIVSKACPRTFMTIESEDAEVSFYVADKFDLLTPQIVWRPSKDVSLSLIRTGIFSIESFEFSKYEVKVSLSPGELTDNKSLVYPINSINSNGEYTKQRYSIATNNSITVSHRNLGLIVVVSLLISVVSSFAMVHFSSGNFRM